MPDTHEENRIEVDTGGLVESTIAQVRGIAPHLTADQRAVIERTIRRYTELRLGLIGAIGATRESIGTEIRGLEASLAGLGEILGARAWNVITSMVTNLVVGALTAAI